MINLRYLQRKNDLKRITKKDFVMCCDLRKVKSQKVGYNIVFKLNSFDEKIKPPQSELTVDRLLTDISIFLFLRNSIAYFYSFFDFELNELRY